MRKFKKGGASTKPFEHGLLLDKPTSGQSPEADRVSYVKHDAQDGAISFRGVPVCDEVSYTTGENDLKLVDGHGVWPVLILNVNGGRLVCCRGSVVDFLGDAIVNSTNEGMLGGTNLDEAINKKGGEALQDARRDLPADYRGRRCPVGMCRMTIAGNLDANYVIHAVGPTFGTGDQRKEVEANKVLLASAYTAAMQLAIKTPDINSIAFPLICGGVARGDQPLERMVDVGIQAIADMLEPGLEVYMVAFTAVELQVVVDVAKAFVNGEKVGQEGCCEYGFCTGIARDLKLHSKKGRRRMMLFTTLLLALIATGVTLGVVLSG